MISTWHNKAIFMKLPVLLNYMDIFSCVDITFNFEAVEKKMLLEREDGMEGRACAL